MSCSTPVNPVTPGNSFRPESDSSLDPSENYFGSSSRQSPSANPFAPENEPDNYSTDLFTHYRETGEERQERAGSGISTRAESGREIKKGKSSYVGYCGALFSDAIFRCYFPMLFSDAIFRCYFPMLFSDAIFRCYFPMLFSDAIFQCYFPI